MTTARQREIRELAERTRNRKITFIYDGDFKANEIEFFLEVRASINNKNRGV